ncbi:hypothetical protein ABMA77_00910 [Halobacteriovorax sp. RZ-1]|uniref:hypothetical protein n=1 Tax=unclassified Halobacteriovorax TaxID=2639665 RepID=UPI00371D82E0
MKNLFLALAILLSSSSVFAMKCSNGDYGIKINYGLFKLGQRIKFYENGDKVLSERFKERYGERNGSLAEDVAYEKFPYSSRDYMTVLETKNSVLVYSVVGNDDANQAGERDTIIFQFKDSNEVVMFDMNDDCELAKPIF